MRIHENEVLAAKKLTEKLLSRKSELQYLNIGKSNEYLGWVNDFKLKDSKNNNIKLDLKKDNDLFLLFILAIVWSRTGIWENSAFFVSYLNTKGKDNVEFWLNEFNFKIEEEHRLSNAEIISKELTSHTPPRKKISFRKDIFKSINILSQNWQSILDKLETSEKLQDFTIFMKYIRSIEGLGVGNKRILIKISLILRELRCQNRYKNIPGELCCVVDDRVFQAGKLSGIHLYKPTDLESLMESSAKIYKLFGDLYDLPLFAAQDLNEMS